MLDSIYLRFKPENHGFTVSEMKTFPHAGVDHRHRERPMLRGWTCFSGYLRCWGQRYSQFPETL